MKLVNSLYYRHIVDFLKKGNLVSYLLGFVDLLLLFVTFQGSYYFMNLGSEQFFFLNLNYLKLFMYMLPFWILVLHICKIAQIPRTSRYSRLFFEYMQFTVLNAAILYIFHLIFGLNVIPGMFIVFFAVTCLVVLYTMRIIEYKMFKLYRASGYNYINVVLIADGTSEMFIE